MVNVDNVTNALCSDVSCYNRTDSINDVIFTVDAHLLCKCKMVT